MNEVNNGNISVEMLVQNDNVTLIRNALEDIKMKVKTSSLTAELWLQYLELVTILKLFIAAIRLGDMDMYQYCLSKMIPVFHAARHLAYRVCKMYSYVPSKVI